MHLFSFLTTFYDFDLVVHLPSADDVLLGMHVLTDMARSAPRNKVAAIPHWQIQKIMPCNPKNRLTSDAARERAAQRRGRAEARAAPSHSSRDEREP